MSSHPHTMSLRLDADMHRRLRLVVEATETTLSDFIRAAIDTALAAAEPSVLAAAEAQLARAQALVDDLRTTHGTQEGAHQ